MLYKQCTCLFHLNRRGNYTILLSIYVPRGMTIKKKKKRRPYPYIRELGGGGGECREFASPRRRMSALLRISFVRAHDHQISRRVHPSRTICYATANHRGSNATRRSFLRWIGRIRPPGCSSYGASSSS